MSDVTARRVGAVSLMLGVCGAIAWAPTAIADPADSPSDGSNSVASRPSASRSGRPVPGPAVGAPSVQPSRVRATGSSKSASRRATAVTVPQPISAHPTSSARVADLPGAGSLSARSVAAPVDSLTPSQPVPRISPAATVRYDAVRYDAAPVSAPVVRAVAGVIGSQTVAAGINQFFNSTFNWLAGMPGGPISQLIEGALVLVRRSLFFIPSGVHATQVGSTLTITVNTGSVAYFRRDGGALQVSSVPLYCGAQNYSATSVSDVQVNGNGGSAGFVFNAGNVAANLSTSQINSVRFDGTAAFAGTVSSTLGSGALNISGAVRGLSGVTLDAAVRLRTDVAIDAGSGNATFTGAVDATRSGAQSLSVTALGATTFAAAVGAAAPLSSLTTRGIAPVTVKQSADSKTIALHYLQDLENGLLRSRYGIDVAIGDNPSQLYLFDTGGTGFFAGYNSPYWQGVPLGTQPVSTTYGSGLSLNAVATMADITIGQGAQSVSTGQSIQIAAALTGRDGSGEPLDFTDPNKPPILGLFYGNFGANFNIDEVSGQPTLASPLFQLPGNLSSGFLLQLGPIGTQPQLTVGVTDALRDQFPYAIPLGPTTGSTFPVSGYPSPGELAFTGQYSVASSGVSVPLGTYDYPQCSQQCLPSLFDTGATHLTVSLPGVAPPYPYAASGAPILQPGTTFTAAFPTAQGRPPLTWSFTAGTNESANLVVYSPGQPDQPQYVNGGLNPFNDFDVMFDVAKQVIWLRPNGGQSTVSLRSVTTVGGQSYGQNAELDGTYRTGAGVLSVAGSTTLLGDTVINAGGGDVTFSGAVDGAYGLSVNSTGTTTFVRPVGVSRFLASLTTDAGGTTSTAEVFTTGDQTYGDDVSLIGQYRAQQGSFLAAGSTTLTGAGTVLAGDNITFGGAVDSLPGKGFGLTLSAGGGEVHFTGAVGAANPLGGLAIENGSNGQQPTLATAVGPINVDGGLAYSTQHGLTIGDRVTAVFAGGGVVQRFAGDGVLFEGSSPDSQLNRFVISGNGGDGIRAGGAPGAVTGLRVSQSVITGNGGDGVAIDGANCADNAVLSSAIYGNVGNGIVLTGGANGGQPAPRDIAVRPVGPATTQISGDVVAVDGYTGDFEIQVFASPSRPGGVSGKYFLGSVVAPAGPFTFHYAGIVDPGQYVTVTATPITGARNTSEFSTPVPG